MRSASAMNCGGGDVAAGVLAHPPAQQPEERRRRRSAAAARAASWRRGRRPAMSNRWSGPGSPIVRRPERVVGRDARSTASKISWAVPRPSSLAPQPLGVGGEALVEPDVLPRGDGQVVADPLVRELVHDHAEFGGPDAVLEEVAGVHRPGLGLEREAEPAAVVDDRRRPPRTDTGRTGRSRKRDPSGWRASAASASSPTGGRRVGGRCRRSSRSRSARCRRAAPGTVQPSRVSPSSSNDVEPGAGRHDDVVDVDAAEVWRSRRWHS